MGYYYLWKSAEMLITYINSHDRNYVFVSLGFEMINQYLAMQIFFQCVRLQIQLQVTRRQKQCSKLYN